jgi:glyoxylase-like metal-dependent hydrolase (beta-lactamase superfamily II)
MRAWLLIFGGLLLLSACGGVSTTTHRVADDLTIHQLELSVSNVYVVEGAGGSILVDAGDPKQEQKILKGIRKVGIYPGDVRAIVITHAHADHTGSAKALSEELEIPIIIQSEAAEQVAKGRNAKMKPQNLTAVFLKWFLKKKFPTYEPDEPFGRCADLSQWGVDGTVRWIGAHTPGSAIIELDHGAVIAGDLLAGGFLGGGIAPKNPESHYFHDDKDLVRAILKVLASNGTKTFFVGHGGPLDAARVREELADGTEFGRGDTPRWRLTPCR